MKKRSISVQQWLADQALQRAKRTQKEVEDMIPRVEDTVKQHKRLQRENHFSDRLMLAYRGRDAV